MRRLSVVVGGLVISWLLAGCERWDLDRQMEALCKKDAGVKVYEKVTLPPEMFDQGGNPFPGWATRSPEQRLVGGYRLSASTTVLKQGEPLRGEGRLSRYHWQVLRLSDGKVLGEATMYGRSGGDFIVLGHFTSNTCPERLGLPRDLIHAVFIKRGD
ncbi:MAG: hypothetical protein HS128_12450 [Ideonella sp.]|nr:hypothetical protein [Ideonella sp.]